MLSASLYITVCSMKNRLGRWLRRLREPRYLVGLVLASAYFYFTLVVRMNAVRGGARARALNAFPTFAGLAPLVGGAVLLVAAAISWMVPTSGRLLDFPESEVQLLFPAPVTRRSLLLHRLMRSQGGLLFASLIPALAFAVPAGTTLTIRAALGVWILLVTARVYFSAIALSRSQLSSPDPQLRRLARLPIGLLLLAIVVVGRTVARVYLASRDAGFDAAAAAYTAALSTGPARVALLPFVALMRPFFEPEWRSYVAALGVAALVPVLCMVWLLVIDHAFQGESMLPADRPDRRPIAGKATYVARPAAWTLAPVGRPEGAFVWKAAMQMLRVVDRRVILRVVLILVSMSLLVVLSTRSRAVPAIAGTFTAFASIYIVLLAPQILRLDIRQDLQHLELMKTWPIRGAALVRGEMTAPALALALAMWLMIALAFMFSGAAFPRALLTWRLGLAGAGALLGPAMIFGQYTVHNGFALMFPGWVPLGSGRPRGLDAMGQRLLTLGATWLTLAVMLLPGAAVSAVLWLAFYRFLGAGTLVVCALVCAATIALEILMMTEWLGPLFDRLDLASIERPE